MYAEAAEIVAADTEACWRYQERRASVLKDFGSEYGDNAALVEAIRLYREVVLPLAPRADRADDWATTQNNLGNALQALGQRETGTERLEQAVAAYREALKEYTRDRVPYDWAYTQENLSILYRSIFRKTGDAAHLETALAHAMAALEAYREMNATYDIGTAEKLVQSIEAAMQGD